MRDAVIDSHGFLKSAEAHQVQDGDEELFLKDWSAGVDLDNRRGDIVASHVLHDSASAEELASLTLSFFHAMLEGLYLSLCLEGAHE